MVYKVKTDTVLNNKKFLSNSSGTTFNYILIIFDVGKKPKIFKIKRKSGRFSRRKKTRKSGRSSSLSEDLERLSASTTCMSAELTFSP